MNIKKGDTVVVRRGKYRGRPDKPKTGKVLHVFPVENRLIIEGVNIISRHTKPTQKNPKGGIVKKESTINRSNVALFCKGCSAPTKVSYKILEEGGRKKKIRFCRKCGEAL